MSASTRLGYLASGAATLALLAGCSSGGALAPSGSPAGSSLQSIGSGAPSVSPFPAAYADATIANARTAPVVIVADGGNNTVTVFNAKGQVTTTLTSKDGLDFPTGITTDGSGTLYVPNRSSSEVLIFKKPYTSAPKIINDAGYSPTDVAYDTSTGNLGVINNESTAYGAGDVAIFATGSTKPCTTIKVGSSGFEFFSFGAFDKTGNLYVDGFDANNNTIVGVAKGGCKASTVTKLTVKNTIGFPGGIQVLKTGEILIDDQNLTAIYTYAPPSGNSLGSPTTTTLLNGSGDPVTFAITGASDLWVADGSLLAANEFHYPSGGSPIKIFRNNFSYRDGLG
jgi:hypothetical protein